MRSILTFLLLLRLLVPLLAADQEPTTSEPTPKDRPVPPSQAGSYIRVNSTNQVYDFFRPWSKKSPFNRRGLGTVLENNRVLVTAELVADNTYIELERPDTNERCPAQVVVIDHEADLALIQPTRGEFLAGMQPLEVNPDGKVGDRLSIVQLESNGTAVSTQALMTTAEVGQYTIEGYSFLLFRLSCPLQYRDNSFTLPIVRDHSLIGLLLRYDPRSQTVDAISTPVLRHFLQDAEKKPYPGFPRLGVQYSNTRDPQFRNYIKLPEGRGGVYVGGVEPEGPAARAGLQAGDVLLAINDRPIDADGNYQDPTYGKLAITHLTTTEAHCQEKIQLRILRNDQEQTLSVELSRRDPSDYVIDPYVIGRAPRFYVLGGLVFEELSRQFLREWGVNWLKEAPQRFVYFDRYQEELFPEKRKIVFLSQVLPSDSTIGFENLNYLTLEKVNGQPIRSLADLASAVKHPINGFDKLEFSDDPRLIYLDANQVLADAAKVQKLYSLPSMQRL